MAVFYYVAPEAQGTNPLPANPTLVGGPYQQGASVTLPNGVRLDNVQHLPQINVFQLEADTTPWPEPQQYYQLASNLVFDGNVNPTLSRVREQRAPVQVELEELREEKLAELQLQYSSVFFSACGLSTGGQAANWALVLDERRRSDLATKMWYLVDREGDRLQGHIQAAIDATSLSNYQSKVQNTTYIKPRWPAGQVLRVVLRHKTTKRLVLHPVNDIDEWGNALKDIATFDNAIGFAAAAAEAAIEAAYNSGNWATLAAIDVKSYSWPQHWPA